MRKNLAGIATVGSEGLRVRIKSWSFLNQTEDSSALVVLESKIKYICVDLKFKNFLQYDIRSAPLSSRASNRWLCLVVGP